MEVSDVLDLQANTDLEVLYYVIYVRSDTYPIGSGSTEKTPNID